MSVTVNFGSFTKKRNSTKQPTNELSDSRTVVFKESTSVDSPTFILTGNAFDYNYASWNDGNVTRYYFISDIRTVKNNLTEIDCVIDVLATYKTQILSGTHFVSYSSSLGSTYLPDTRIPVLTDKKVKHVTVVNPKISRSGKYVLAVNGENGCCIYKCNESDIRGLINNLNQWRQAGENSFLDNLIAPGGDIVQATENLYTVIARSGAFGNAYSDAPAQIKSCIWVPFSDSAFTVINASKQIYLGQFPTAVIADEVRATPYMETFSGLTIPWEYNDYRRATCEHLYLYLPLVGLVNIATDNIVNETNLTVMFSIMPTDGSIAYEIKAGDQVIGSYGASCAANYPIGISQQSSAGEIINSILSGGESMVNAAIHSSLSPISMAAATAGVVYQGVKASYDTIKIANSRHNTTIGGVGGGVGSGLDLTITLFNVIDKTIVEPSAMQATMGLPTMKPMSLQNLTGFCQCANAHCEANAMAIELDAIDSYLNNGFFIE